MVVLSGVLSHALDTPAGGALPSEFRIFQAGENSTAKGTFTFDARAAALVMAAYEQTNRRRLMCDVEHDSLHPERRAQRSDAGDARGWFSLALRPDGSLWACDVTWTPDGARRLTEKTQAFISPAFTCERDGDVMRPAYVVNAALCAVPAMHDAPALVAASRLDFRPRSARVLAALSRAASIISHVRNTR